MPLSLALAGMPSGKESKRRSMLLIAADKQVAIMDNLEYSIDY